MGDSFFFLSVITSNTKVYGQSPCAPAVDIYSCDPNVTLTSTSLGGYTYDWYDDHCPPSSFCAAPTYLSSGNVYSNYFADGDYYFHYDATNVGGTCSSGSIHLVVATTLAITPPAGSPPVALSLDITTDPNVALMGWTNFQWYRNYSVIPGATSDHYTANTAGTYILQAFSPYCGSKSTSNVVVGCGTANTYTANYIFPPGLTSLSNTTVVLDGTILVPPDASVMFNNCEVIMKSGAEIIVQKAAPWLGLNNGGAFTSYNSRFSSCDKWGGIYAEGYDNTTANNPYSAYISITYSEIHDAYIGLYADYNANLTLDHNIFENNYRHIDLRSFTGEQSGCGAGGNQGVNLNINHNTFNYLMETVPAFTPLNLPSTPNNNYYRKMVYIDDSKTIKLHDNTFVCVNWANAFDENAIEVHNVSPAICSIDGFEVNQCYFAGILMMQYMLHL